MALEIDTSKLSKSVNTISKLIKHPKLQENAYTQLAFVSYQNTLYILGAGLSVPKSQVTLGVKLLDNTGLEDFTFYTKQSDVEKIFSTLGSTTTLDFTDNSLEIYSNNEGLITELSIFRQKPFSNDTEKTYQGRIRQITDKFTAVSEEDSTDTKGLLSVLGHMAKMRSVDNSDSVTFEPNRISVQQYNYVAQEPFDVGFTARVTLDETKLLMELLRISETGKLVYEDTTLKFYNESIYFEVNNIRDETYDLNKFTYDEDNGVYIDKKSFLDSLNMMKNYVDNMASVYLLVEDDSLVVTTTQTRHKSLSVPVVKIPYLHKGTSVVNRDYSVLLPIVQGITSILDGNQLTLYFEYKEYDTSLLYISSGENTNFMYLDAHEQL